MRNRLISFCLLVFTALPAVGQNEAFNWYFGNGVAINFSSANPRPLNDGELYTSEGCASISDNKAQLLFYSDGVTIWDKNHTVMLNGTGLSGANSSTQSCLILKKPGEEKKYYFFTTDELAGPKGFSYSIIDMSQNRGLGAVTTKNQRLLSPVTEKLTAIKQGNGKGWWVIVHQWNSNAFYCYSVDNKGISDPVISKVGSVHRDVGSKNNSESIGYLKGSPDGTKLAEAICYIPDNAIELFDFNNQTGAVSNPHNLPSGGNAYGISFSPDNSKLYVSYQVGGAGIIQYNLLSTDIAGTAIRVSRNDSTRFGAMQIGPDGKLYVAKLGQYLDVITHPNSYGKSCGYKKNAVNLKGKYSTFGLPDFFILAYTTLRVKLGNDTAICEKRMVLDAKNPGARFLWSTGQTDQKITIFKSGTYRVTVSNATESFTDSIKIKFRKPIELDLGRDTTVCMEKYRLDGGNSGLGYKWSTGAGTQVVDATISGTYAVTVSDGICVKSDSIKVTFMNKTNPIIPVKQFKPNNGGFNDRFDYILHGIISFKLQITNDRGKILFESNDRKKEWDGNYNGKEVAPGGYNWEIQYKTVCSGAEIRIEKGMVTVLKKTE